MALIDVTGLCKSFQRGKETVAALRGVDLQVEPGEFISITGPSGSGKSTLMYILGLIDQQSSGQYLLEGQATNQLNDDQRARLRNQKLGFVFQGFHLLPRATALRNVAMPLVYSASYDRSYSEEKIRELATAALVTVGLGERLNHRPNELSGGQCQRVAIARALVNRPKILFADEPTGNLDSKNGDEILKLFESLNQQGVTIILVTHDVTIAERSKRKIKMFDGSISLDSYAHS